MTEEVFRQNIKVGTEHYGKVGFAHYDGKDQLEIIGFEEDSTITLASFPFEAVPQLIKLLLHAWTTKTREKDDDCFAFPKMKEDE